MTTRQDSMKEPVIIGGSDAGISAALRAREVDPSRNVRLVVADRYPNYSICGLPFYLSGETPRWEDLAHRTRAEIERHGIELLLDTIERGAFRVSPDTPPLGSPWDPVQTSCMEWTGKPLEGRA